MCYERPPCLKIRAPDLVGQWGGIRLGFSEKMTFGLKPEVENKLARMCVCVCVCVCMCVFAGGCGS